MKKVLYISREQGVNEREYRLFTLDCQDLYCDAVYRFPLLMALVIALRFINWLPMWVFYGDWKRNYADYDLVILDESLIKPTDIRHLSDRKHGGYERVVVAYRNHISLRQKFLHQEALRDQVREITYNLDDAAQYGITYEPQYWNKELIRQIDECDQAAKTDTDDGGKQGDQENYKDQRWGLTFVGEAKTPKRYEMLMQIKRRAEQQGIVTNFWIRSMRGEAGTHREYRSYEEYLRDVTRSAAVLDVVDAQNNWGLTLRPLEAMFLHRLLVTNYTDIVRYDFYEANKDNIYILRDEQMDGLAQFLLRGYVDNDLDIDEYDFERWVERLL